MNEITGITDTITPAWFQHTRAVAPPAGLAERPGGASGTGRVDSADFSELGQLLSLAGELPDVRADRIAEVKTAIERDPEKFIGDRLEGTVDRLHRQLLGE